MDTRDAAGVDVAIHYGVSIKDVVAAYAAAFELPKGTALAKGVKAFIAALPPLLN